MSAAQDQLTWLMETLPAGLVRLDADWTITYVNANAERSYARSRDQLVGMTVWDAFPEAVGTVIEDAYRQAMATGVPGELQVFFEPLATHFDVRIFPHDAGLTLFFYAGDDVNRAQQALGQALAAKDDVARRLIDLSVAEEVAQLRSGPFCEVLEVRDPHAVREARRLTERVCASASLDDRVCQAAVLLTSEVVTNAITHGRGEARLSVTAGPRGLLVEVADDNSRRPTLQPHDDEALDGRGLRLLDAVSTSWGVRAEPVGKVVWFSLRAS